jgi:methionyl-tRNA synthetase
MPEKFYITTAIDYVNANPHIGTAYEKIAADFIARSRRLLGYDTRFLMGNDEHSINVARAAAAEGLTPLAYCDRMEARFRAVWETLQVSCDDFIRTTEARHARAVGAVFAAIHAAGYIYKGKYEGYYCDSCEAFKQEKDLVGGDCPLHRRPPRWLEEENYFFALSRFAPMLREHIHRHPEFVRPEVRRNEVLALLDSGLEDISVSRSGADWGIPLPIDATHVVYVWFDALINYIAALGYPDDPERLLQRYWPCDLHVIGKDITRFHCIIWPAMLHAAGIPLPRSVWAHGFVSVSGERMSKTLGNVIAPAAAVERFGADAFRYLFLREVPFDRDGDFSWAAYTERYNADLANDLGNLLARTLAMVQRYWDAQVPPLEAADGRDRPLLDVLQRAAVEYVQQVEGFAPHAALAAVWSTIQAANRYIETTKPWELAKNPGERARLGTVLRNLLEVLRCASIMVYPAMPAKAAEMRRQLGLPDDFSRLRYTSELVLEPRPWSRVHPGPALFPRLESKA